MAYQSTDVPVVNCHKQRHGSGNRIKSPCGMCQSCKDRALSEQITRNHQYGRFCKGNRNNQCSICAQIKWRIRLLFHAAGCCMKNCPFHEPNKQTQFYMPRRIKDFYKMMFGLEKTHGNKHF